MDFVTAAANLRMHIFSMNMKSRFDVKCECVRFLSLLSVHNKSIFAFDGSDFTLAAFIRRYDLGLGSSFAVRLTVICVRVLDVSLLAMAGNIIPAIATTNAVIAGLIVLEALKILNSDFQQCRTVRRVILCMYLSSFFF